MSDFSVIRAGRAALLALLALSSPGLAPEALAQASIECDTGVPASEMALFDAHNHFDTSSLEAGYGDLGTLAAGGVEAGALVLGPADPDDLPFALGLQYTSPAAVRVFSMPATVTMAGGVKTYTAGSVALVADELDRGAVGVGEMKLRHSGPPQLEADIAANQVFAMQIYALAEERGVPVTIHFETREKSAPGVDVPSRLAELSDALDTHPGAAFVWAHAGDTDWPTVRSLVESHDNLYVDLSTRNPHFIRGWPASLQSLSSGAGGTGALKTGWKNLFHDYPDRFLIGFDLANSSRWEQLSDVAGYYRSVLGELDPEVAEKIACKNAQLLFSSPATAVPALGQRGTLLLVIAALVLGAAFLALRAARERLG